uniref:Transmembrane protein n=1 Tax=Meloidogyne incognita TaxID=6306 RepID=A0A914LJL0_MELIC
MDLTCSISASNPSSSRLREEIEENALNEGREEEEIDSNVKEEGNMEGNEGKMEEGEEETDEEMEENKDEEEEEKGEERDEYKEEEEEISTIKRKNKNLAVDPQIASTSYCHDVKGNFVKEEEKEEKEDLMNTKLGDQQLLNKPFQHQQLSTTTFSPSTLPHNNCIAKHQTFTDPNIQTPQKQTLNYKQNNNKVYLNEQQQDVLEETFDENKLENNNKLVLNRTNNVVVVNGENLKHENESRALTTVISRPFFSLKPRLYLSLALCYMFLLLFMFGSSFIETNSIN